MQLPYKYHYLRDDCRQCTATHTPPKTKDKQWVECHIYNDRHNGCRHRFQRLPRGSYQCVEAEIEVSDYRPAQYYEHKIVGIRQRIFARSEEIEYRFQEY